MLYRAVRIGMIGCGTQANIHFAGIKALGADQATVAAVCDLDDERSRGRLPALARSPRGQRLPGHARAR